MKGLTNYLSRKVIITIPFCCLLLISQGQIVGSRDNSAAPAREVKAAALSGGESGDVNLFTGTFGSTQTLGTVKTLSGLSFTLNLSWNSSFTAGDNPGIISGIPYGDGWNLDIPTITISTAAYHKYTAQQEIDHFTTTLGGTKSELDFTHEDLYNEGGLFWFSPIISIPGVINERFVFKYKDVRSNQCVFVPHTFEKYVEARFDGRSWQVILDDGTVYDFSLCQLAQRAPSNQKVLNSEGLDIRSNGRIMDNLLLPKNEALSWYCGKIRNPNHAFGQMICFNYDAYGAFDFFTELTDQPKLMTAYASLYHPYIQFFCPFQLVDRIYDSENETKLNVAYKDILLKEVTATVDGGVPYDRIQLNYNTVNDQNTPSLDPIRPASESINGVILQPSNTSGLLVRVKW